MTAADHLKIVQAIEGVKIQIDRSGYASAITPTLRAETKGEIVGEDGSQTLYATRDWLVTVDQTGELGKPKRGDTITDLITNRTYTVGHPDPTTRVVNTHGNDGTCWRIHSIEEGAL
jgi:hypothetical protein